MTAMCQLHSLANCVASRASWLVGLTVRDDEEPADLVWLERSNVSSTVQVGNEPAQKDVVSCKESTGRQDDEEVHGNVDLSSMSARPRRGSKGPRRTHAGRLGVSTKDDSQDKTESFGPGSDDKGEKPVTSLLEVPCSLVRPARGSDQQDVQAVKTIATAK